MKFKFCTEKEKFEKRFMESWGFSVASLFVNYSDIACIPNHEISKQMIYGNYFNAF